MTHSGHVQVFLREYQVSDQEECIINGVGWNTKLEGDVVRTHRSRR